MAASCNAQRSTGGPWRARWPRARLVSEAAAVMSSPVNRTAWRELANRRTSPNSAQMLTAAGPADPVATHERLAARLAAGGVAQGGVQLVELGVQEVDRAQGQVHGWRATVGSSRR